MGDRNEKSVRVPEADFYDQFHTEGNVPETRALYYTLLRKVVHSLKDRGSRSILEVGSGSGFLAE